MSRELLPERGRLTDPICSRLIVDGAYRIDVMSELGRFIPVRRGQLKPTGMGLPDFGDRRRVPGLCREEVAQLAGSVWPT